jgi:2-dehydropantoate 2-reductase
MSNSGGGSAKRAYTIIGAGAIGGTVGHALIKAGHRVLFVDTDADHVAAITSRGLRIQFPDGTEDVVSALAFTPETFPAEFEGIERAVIATKSQHTRSAAQWVAPRLTEGGYVVSLQNGRNEPVVAAEVGAEHVLGAFVDIFADWEAPGVIKFGGPGALSVGLPDGGAPDGRVLQVASDFRAYGAVTSTANLPGYRWAKRGFASILGLTSLADAPIADVVDGYRDLAALAARESTEVAIRSGVVLESFDAYEPYAFSDAAPPDVRELALDRLVSWLRTQPKDRSGGFRDIAVRRRPTESALIDDGYGDLAVRHGVDTSTTGRVHAALQQIVSGERAFGYSNLDELRDAVSRQEPAHV